MQSGEKLQPEPVEPLQLAEVLLSLAVCLPFSVTPKPYCCHPGLSCLFKASEKVSLTFCGK